MRAPKRVDRRVVDFRITREAGVMPELRNIVREKNGGRGASSRGFCPKTRPFWGGGGGDATHVYVQMLPAEAEIMGLP